MKRGVCILVLVLGLFASTVQAQVRMGVKAGVNISKVSGDNISDFVDNNLTGFHVGPTVEWLINGQFGLEGGLLYSEKGIKFKERKANRVGFIEVPIDLKYRFETGSIVKPYISAGPYISFKVSGDGKFSGMTDDVVDQWKAKSFGGGLNFRAGVELFNFLQVGAQYQLGLTDNYKADDGHYSVKERIWSASAAVYF
ncbi:MAG: porin family protein [Dysgonomonas sp.]|nr:porin family protein [Dysgonomonas sp.]